jgi:membrane protease YdiL (CAAX protease family)
MVDVPRTPRGRGERNRFRKWVKTVLLANAALSALLQLVVLGGLPFLGYALYQRARHRRAFGEAAQRAGLQPGKLRYLRHSGTFALAGAAVLVIWTPPLEPLLREGSAMRQFVGLGWGPQAIAAALLYGAVKTAFVEELIFRGMIAGSLARRLPPAGANLAQAVIFLLPHLAILLFAPELWGLLPMVFLGALLFGWVRIRSGSILGPWLMHASGNVTMALIVVTRTAA